MCSSPPLLHVPESTALRWISIHAYVVLISRHLLVQVTIAVEGLESGNLLVVFDGNTATPFKTLVYFVTDPGFGTDISLGVTFVTCGEDARARSGGSRCGKSE